MTVQELIDELLKVEDKSKEVIVLTENDESIVKKVREDIDVWLTTNEY
jgi:hypothetical protein|nr:MAG TPA: hypothetical protein [Caudoviricetes sp.]